MADSQAMSRDFLSWYTPPPRSPIDYENAIGAYPAKGILGTQLGPNQNGTKGPWPSWRGS
jgi:hypothetical protein